MRRGGAVLQLLDHLRRSGGAGESLILLMRLLLISYRVTFI